MPVVSVALTRGGPRQVERGDKRPLPPVRQRTGMAKVAVGHKGRDRAERLRLVNLLGPVRVTANEQMRRDEGAFLQVALGCETLLPAENQLRR